MRSAWAVAKCLEHNHNVIEKSDLRVGQLIVNALDKASLFYIEDDELVRRIDDYCRNLPRVTREK